MEKLKPFPKYEHDLKDFSVELRKWVFYDPQEAADYFHKSRPTITRYENGTYTPDLGYLAGLIVLIIKRLKVDYPEDSQVVEVYKKTALEEINNAFRFNRDRKSYKKYNSTLRFPNWEELEEFANVSQKKHIDEKQSSQINKDDEVALENYLCHLISGNHYLELQGIPSEGQLVELDQIYIPLRATYQQITQSVEIPQLPSTSITQILADSKKLMVLGDPGSGKTTLLRYLAFLYAHDMIEKTNWVQDRLGLDEGNYLPIFLYLRQVDAYIRESHPKYDGIEGHLRLLNFLDKSLKNEGIDLPNDFFENYLTTGKAIILLDGFDEVTDFDLRKRISRLIQGFIWAYPECRYVITSRSVAYSNWSPPEGFTTITIRNFILEDVERFLATWYQLVIKNWENPDFSADTYAAEKGRQLYDIIEANEWLRDLAVNPLMLTIIVAVYDQDGAKLPDRQMDLYNTIVDGLLGKWDKAPKVESFPILEKEDGSFDIVDKRQMLQNVALSMQEKKQKTISALDLNSTLRKMFLRGILSNERKAEQAAKRFLQFIIERTGLLKVQEKKVYTFSHPTFQEYLAARAIAERDDFIEYTLNRAADPEWWQVIIREACYLNTQDTERAHSLIKAIINFKKEPHPYYNLDLAAECLREIRDTTGESWIALPLYVKI